MKYTYQLHKGEKTTHALYSREELERLTTLQLREICKIEKIVIGVTYKLDRKYIIDTILKYRGQQQFEYIDFYSEDWNKEMLNKLKKHLHCISSEKQFSITTRIAAYLDNDITIDDQYIVVTDKKYGGNVLLLDEQKNVCGIWNMIQENGQNFLINNYRMMKSDLQEAIYKNYSLGFLDETTSRTFYCYYYGLAKLQPIQYNCYTKTIAELLISRTKEISTTLVIDFGTSNTALGAYMDERQYPEHTQKELLKRGIPFGSIDKIKFETVNENNEKVFAETFPTVISVKDCSDTENITYHYGYDAVDTASRDSFNSKASVFYEIKKWVNNYEKIEEVYDEKGNIAFVARKEILKQYFYYIIKATEQRHKCKYKKLHITSPIRQKQQFLAMYEEVLGEDYIVSTITALDEGIAVLYNSISNQIKNRNFEEGEEYKALVMDCGGGTTDLTSCIYTIEDNKITYQLDLKTVYANGDIHFGGNNITYRIMQYLKILFSAYYQKQKVPFIGELFQTSSIDLFREAMKEYMPGKIIETSGDKKTAQHYKLSCVEGAIQYENAKKIGLIAPILTDEVPITPYQLTTFTYNDTEVIMMSSFEKITKTYGFVSKNIDTEKIDLILKNQEGIVLHTYQLTILPEELQKTTYEQTSEEYADKILQDDIDNIADGEMKLFTFSYGDKWGFCALPIARKEGQLLMGEKRYFPFESDEWESSFFDRMK